MVSARSRTSVAVGRFIVIDTPKAAIWAGVAAPVMIWSIAQAAWPAASSDPAVERPRTCGHVVVGAPGSGAATDGVTGRSSHVADLSPRSGKTSCDQFGPWLYLDNYKASYFIL